MYYNDGDIMKDEIISVRILPNGYGKASKEIRDYILHLHDEIVELQQENERLKEANAELKAITKRPTPIDYAMIQKRYEDYKSCCEKASELLQKYGNGTFDENLLNILQNERNKGE